MSEIIEFIISGLIMSIVCHIIWINSGNIEFKSRPLKVLISICLLSLVLVFNYCFINNYMKVVFSAICCCLIIRIFLCNDIKKSINLTLYSEVIYILSEIIFSVIMLAIFRNNLNMVMNEYFGSLLTNFCISLLAICLFSMSYFKNMYDFLHVITSKIRVNNIIVLSFVLITSINIFLAMPYYKISTVTIVIVNTLLLFIYTVIIVRFIQEKNRFIDISDKYRVIEVMFKELQSSVNRLMALNHENKNQLLTIRTMIANKDKDVLDKIDSMVEVKIKEDKQLKIRTSAISDTMLGSLIYNKLLTMKEKCIKYNLHIDKNLNKAMILSLDNNVNVDICKIVGVYLDNAIDATMETEEKELNIDLYLEDNYFNISVANTFVGNIDLKCINDYGYTTKNDGHGYGLALVYEITKKNENLITETNIINNVFVQRLQIKM